MSQDAWRVFEVEVPEEGTVEERLRSALRYAVLAPSAANAQPWRFRLDGGRLLLYADRARGLPVADPAGRELVMSCGAALAHLELALHRFGHAPDVAPVPDAGTTDLLARVSAARRAEPAPEVMRLFDAIPRRRTCRGRLLVRPVAESLADALADVAERAGAWLAVLPPGPERSAVAALVAAGERIQQADPHFRAEAASWLRSGLRSHDDGIPVHSLDRRGLSALLAPWTLRAANTGRFRARAWRRAALGSPLLVVVGTDADGLEEWLRAGRALARVLLRAAADGAGAAFFNQAVQVDSTRRRLAEVVGGQAPQAVLGIGFRPPARPTPRRPVEEVLFA